MSAVPTKHKKNLGGGKGHKRTSGKESRGSRHNRETTDAFIDDLVSGEDLDGVTIARVVKVFGGARMSLLMADGKEVTAQMKGTLRCSKGAARHADNPIACSAGTFVVLQSDDVLTQVIGVLNRKQVKEIQKSGFPAVRDFFEQEGGVDDGFEWDLDEGGGGAADEDDGGAAGKSGGKGGKATLVAQALKDRADADDDVDIDAI
jgi:hypothetical protein